MKTRMIDTYRRCGRCGKETMDMKRSMCSCGGYMAVISTVYVPAVRRRAKR